MPAGVARSHVVRRRDAARRRATLSTSIQGVRLPLRRAAYAILWHPRLGFLLLRTWSPGLGMHHHLPGGRVDEEDEDDDDPHVAAAQRETREETGVALEPGRFEAATDDDGEPLVLGGRAYFFVRLTDDDVHTESLLRRSRRRLAEKTPGFKVRRDYRRPSTPYELLLSEEHTGWTFEPDVDAACLMIEPHSDGLNAVALSLLGNLEPRAERGSATCCCCYQ